MNNYFKSKTLSPSKLVLAVRNKSNINKQQHLNKNGSLHKIELRYTEVWTGDHLEWFNVDFNPSQFQTLPMAFKPYQDIKIWNDEILTKAGAIVDEYRKIIPKVLWNCTSLPEKGQENWIEVSARPARMMQLLVSSLIKFLIVHLSGGEISVEMQRNEKLKIVYAGHSIFKDKYFGIVRCDGTPVLSIEETDVKYLYGRTCNAQEDIEYINAAHVFSDILAMSQNYQDTKSSTTNGAAKSLFKSVDTHTGDETNGILKHFSTELFVVNVLQGEISLFWSSLPYNYSSLLTHFGRPPKSMRVTLNHTKKYSLFSADGVKGFITEFAHAFPRITQR